MEKRNVPSGEERGETDVLAGYSLTCRLSTSTSTPMEGMASLTDHYFGQFLVRLVVFLTDDELFSI